MCTIILIENTSLTGYCVVMLNLLTTANPASYLLNKTSNVRTFTEITLLRVTAALTSRDDQFSLIK